MKLIKHFIAVLCLVLASTFAANAQTLYATSSTSSQAPVRNGLANLSIPMDVRAFTSDPEIAENADTAAAGADNLNFTRVIFSDNSGGLPENSTGVCAKLYFGQFNYASSGVSAYVLAIPESGFSNNNPYITVQNDDGSGWNTVYSFQVVAGTGGVLTTRPFFLEGDSNQIIGSIKALCREQPIMASGTITLLDGHFPGWINQSALVKVLVHGLPASSPDAYIELSATGKVTSTLSGSSLVYQRISANSNVTEVSFQLPSQFTPVTGDSGFTVNLKIKKGSTGSWSPTKSITFQ